jgi:signal transduction histidine kinase
MVMHRHDEVNYTKVDMEKIVRQTLERRLSSDHNNQIDFDLTVSPQLRGKALVVGDGVSLREAVENIVSNAIQHADREVKIIVSLNLVGETGDLLELRIEDNGPGMSAEHKVLGLERFRAFGPKAGSGVGLSIVAAVVRHHRGQIRLFDAETGGLGVELKLPIWKG